MDDNVYNQCLRCVCVCVGVQLVWITAITVCACVDCMRVVVVHLHLPGGEGGVINTTFVYMYVCSSCCFSCLGIIDVCV